MLAKFDGAPAGEFAGQGHWCVEGEPHGDICAFGDVSRVVLAGAALGVALSLGVTRLVASFLYGVKPTDTVTLGASVLLLAAVGVAAAAVPAWRAARLDPVAALREE